MKVINTRISILNIKKIPNDTISRQEFIGPSNNENNSVYKKSISRYQIRNINSCEFSETYNNLTQTGFFTIPIKNTVLYRDTMDNNTFVPGYLFFKSGQKLFIGDSLIIDIGYGNHYQTRFIGYITKFEETDDLMTIHFEDSMYMLKKTIAIKNSFPKVIPVDFFYNNKFNKEEFKLNHLVYWILQTLMNYKPQTEKNILVPKTRTYETKLGKVLIKDPVTPAEIFKYYLKNVFNMKVFFRNEYVNDNYPTPSTKFENVMEPVLYIGWSNWNGIAFKEYGVVQSKKQSKSSSKKGDSGEDIITVDLEDIGRSSGDFQGFKYSQTFKFAYPYHPSYNPIVENNLEWYNTDKHNLKVSTQSTITVIYQYGEFTTKIKDNSKKRKKKEKDDKKLLDKKLLNTTVVKDLNTLETFNEVNLSYPNLSKDELKTKCEEYYKSYPDSGLKGSFTILGEPYVRQGDLVQLRLDTSHVDAIINVFNKSNKKPTMNKLKEELLFVTYYIKAVKTSFTQDGGLRQILTIDKEYK